MASNEKKAPKKPAGEPLDEEVKTEAPAPETGEETRPGAETSVEELPVEDEAVKLREEMNALNERLLRLMAEYDNYRKRTAREKDAIYPDAVAATVEKFLPVLDNFQRALEAPCTDGEFKKGMSMICDGLVGVLTGLGVEAIGEVGEEFSPTIHNAVMHIDDEALGKNVVAQVFQKGYRIGDKVLRYAMVQQAN